MEIENQNIDGGKTSILSKKKREEEELMDEEVDSAAFDQDNEDTEETENEDTATENNEEEDEDLTEEDDDETGDEEIELEDDEDEHTSRRTVTTAGRKRGRGRPSIKKEEEETDAQSIIVALGDDVDVSLHVETLLCRQTFPISRWLSMFARMNTRYVKNGSRLEEERWQDISGEKLQENVQLYMVKWRNLSYLHCSWESEQSLLTLEGTRMKQKIGKFLRNEANLMFDLSAYGTDVYFNPDFMEVDRVLDARIVPKSPDLEFEVEGNSDIEALLPSNEYGERGNFVKEFRIKWKGLQYSELSWEVFEDFQDTEAIDLYYEHLNRDVSDQIHIPAWRPRISEYRKIGSDIEYKEGNRLRSYQVEGANWMIWNWTNGRNSILADEMGLGKTIQSTMFMYTLLKNYKMKYPFLVVAPLSTIPHWEAEIRRWTDMHVVVLHGSVESRENILRYEWKTKLGEFDVLITTYEIAIVEANLLSSICWTGVVVDEAHRLKGRTNKLGDVLRKIDFGCKLLLTGTPLQNNTEELWTLLNFLQPDKFSDPDQFQTDFGDMKDSAQLEKLHDVLKPYMLRRMKEDVEKSLKPKEEIVINVEMTAMQKTFYRAVYDHNTSVFIGKDNKNLPSLMNVMMELRKCCNHPFLIRGAEQTIIAETQEKKPNLKADDFTLDTLLSSSGKMVLLDKLLPKLQAQGHKVLLFSQMVRMLDIIQDYLAIKGYSFERIDGSVKVSDRQAAIERFSAPGSDRFIFLICTRAGGFGINLTAADTVIIYDSDWNPQNDIQAQARCHRIGQDKAVNVYRLITNRTYEMQMFQRANLKLGLDKAVLNPLKQSITSDGSSEMNKMSKKEAETLLRYGAYDFFKEEREGKSEELSNAFCEADIDQILEKNTKVITIDSQGGSSFSKASFITDTSAEVDINDPDFWTNVVGLHGSPDAIGPRSHRRLGLENGDEKEFENEGAAMIDENEWNKSDRDALLRLLLSFGWGNWEPIYNNEKMKKHPRNSIHIMAISLIGQMARGQRILDENEAGGQKSGKGTKIRDQAKEAIEFFHDRYDVCSAVMESMQKAEAGDPDAIAFPPSLPVLVRDGIWWRKEIKATDRHLKHLSFLIQLRKVCKTFDLKIDSNVPLPTPRRAVLPTTWWTVKEDRDALLGVIRDGWGNWKEICNDPDLCFFKDGVIYKEQKQSETTDDNQTETPTETPEAAESPTPQAENGVKIFPSPYNIMKRIRRLVSAMCAMQGNVDDMNFDLSTSMSPKKSRAMKNGVMIGDWSQIELKNLRSAILRWGLPVPPTHISPKKEKQEQNRENRTVFTIESIPMTEEQQKMEECMAGAAAVLSSMIQHIVLKENETTESMEVEKEKMTNEEKLVREEVVSHCWLDPYPCHTFDSQREFGLYSNRLGPFEFLRIQAKLKTKSVDRVQEMCRKIEKRVVERFQQSKDAHNDPEEGKKEKEKEKEDITDIVPSNTIAQRLYRRIQLYYDIQQYIWDKDEETMIAIIKKWEEDGPRRLDRLSDGWVPAIHDMAFIKGIRKWGFVEWDLFWSYPEMPFVKPIPEKKKDQENETPAETPEVQAANEAIMNAKTMDHSVIIPGLTAGYAIRRLQSLLEMFRDYDTFDATYHFMCPNEEDTLPEGQQLVSRGSRQIVVTFDDDKYFLPQNLTVRQSIHWKKSRSVPHVFSLSSRSEVYRGDPSRAQITNSALHYYEKWLEMEKVVSAANMNIRKLPPDTRKEIHERAADILRNVTLPMRIRSVTILDFGMIPSNWQTYQSDKYIWPIGYKSKKTYFSFISPSEHIEYINEILDGGVRGPIFSVTPTDDMDHPITASTATGCWSTILGRVRKERCRLGLGKTGTAVSGPEFFGFAMPEVAACIEGLEGSETCKDYVYRCLRMETSRKGKTRLTTRKPKTSFIEEDVTEVKHAPRRAAQLASQRWQIMNESESSADFTEEEESAEEVNPGSDSDTLSQRKSKKRVAPSTKTEESSAKLTETSQLSDIKEEKVIKTEQFL